MVRPKPTGLTKWFFKAPSYLYRARLGFLMGERFLMMEHRGRKSGNLYRTVIEVAGRNRRASEWIVTAGYGPKSDWYQNLAAGNLEAVWIGSKRHSGATARFLDADEAADYIELYEKDHPKAAEILFKSMDVSHDGTREGRVEMMKEIPMVALAV